MTARDVYNASVLTANAAKLTSDFSTDVTEANSLAAAKTTFLTNTPDNQGGAAFTTFDTSTRNANRAWVASRIANEMARQASIAQAREVLRGTGDLSPA